MNVYTKLVIFLVLVGGVFGAYFFFDIGQHVSLEVVQAQRMEFEASLAQSPILYTGLFSLLYIISVALSLPIAAILSLLAGFLFGVWIGTAVVVVSATIGATLIFLFARFFVGNEVLAAYQTKAGRLVEEIEQNGFSYLLFLRLVPLFPFFLVNIVPAATSMKTRTFFLATLLGIIPGSLAYVAAGTSLSMIESVGDVITPPVLAGFAALGVISLVPVLWKKYATKTATKE